MGWVAVLVDEGAVLKPRLDRELGSHGFDGFLEFRHMLHLVDLEKGSSGLEVVEIRVLDGEVFHFPVLADVLLEITVHEIEVFPFLGRLVKGIGAVEDHAVLVAPTPILVRLVLAQERVEIRVDGLLFVFGQSHGCLLYFLFSQNLEDEECPDDEGRDPDEDVAHTHRDARDLEAIAFESGQVRADEEDWDAVDEDARDVDRRGDAGVPETIEEPEDGAVDRQGDDAHLLVEEHFADLGGIGIDVFRLSGEEMGDGVIENRDDDHPDDRDPEGVSKAHEEHLESPVRLLGPQILGDDARFRILDGLNGGRDGTPHVVGDPEGPDERFPEVLAEGVDHDLSEGEDELAKEHGEGDVEGTSRGFPAFVRVLEREMEEVVLSRKADENEEGQGGVGQESREGNIHHFLPPEPVDEQGVEADLEQNDAHVQERNHKGGSLGFLDAHEHGVDHDTGGGGNQDHEIVLADLDRGLGNVEKP